MTCFSPKLIFTLLLLALSISTSSAYRRSSRHSDNAEQYLRDLCSRIDGSDLCLSIIKSESHRFDSSDEVDIAVGVIGLAVAKSEQIGDQLNQWYKDSNEDRMREKYRSCSDSYIEATRYLKDAQRNIDSDNYRSISDQIEGAEKELDECRREFDNSSADPGHVGNKNNELRVYLDMVRAATDQAI